MRWRNGCRTECALFACACAVTFHAFARADAFLETRAHELPLATRAAWAHAVAAAVAARYREMCVSLLDTVHRDEQARVRLAIKPAAAAVNGGVSDGEVSDVHKIAVQMCLDVQAFRQELHTICINPDDLPEYAALADAVRPDELLVGSLVFGHGTAVPMPPEPTPVAPPTSPASERPDSVAR